jgi:hypothetical protein
VKDAQLATARSLAVYAARDNKSADKIASRRRLIVMSMKYAMRRFFRLLRPLVVMAAIVIWVSGHTDQARSAGAGPKLPVESAKVLSQFAVTFDQQHQRACLKRP